MRACARRALPTAGIRFSFIKTKCYCAQWTVQLLNCPAQIIVDRCICHCVHCTVPPSYFWLFRIRIEVCTLLRNDFAAIIQKGSFLTLLSVEVKVRAFSFTPPFATASICYDITEVVVRPQEPVDPVEAVEPQDTPQSCRGWDIWPLDLGKSLKVLRP